MKLPHRRGSVNVYAFPFSIISAQHAPDCSMPVCLQRCPLSLLRWVHAGHQWLVSGQRESEGPWPHIKACDCDSSHYTAHPRPDLGHSSFWCSFQISPSALVPFPGCLECCVVMAFSWVPPPRIVPKKEAPFPKTGTLPKRNIQHLSVVRSTKGWLLASVQSNLEGRSELWRSLWAGLRMLQQLHSSLGSCSAQSSFPHSPPDAAPRVPCHNPPPLIIHFRVSFLENPKGLSNTQTRSHYRQLLLW